MVKLGLTRNELRTILEQQISAPDLQGRAIAVRENSFGGPLLNVRAAIVGSTDVSAYLVSSWEVGKQSLRLVTAWAEILSPQEETSDA